MQKTVLLVEDDAGDRNMYGNILWYNGYNVIVAEDGEAGLRLAQENHPDLIILDLRLPILPGLELNSRLKQDDDTKNIPVIALTARTLGELGGNAQVLGYERFLEKPVSPLLVLREVERLIGAAHVDQSQDRKRPQVYRTHVPEGTPASTEKPEPLEHLLELAVHMRANIDTILARWTDLVRAEPWFSLPPEHRTSNLSAVVAALIECAVLPPGSADCTRAIVTAGADHGHNRRGQGVPETLIPIEFHLLRQAVWRFLNDSFPPSEAVHQVQLSVDSASTTALNAAMWGYYRDEIEAHEGWDTALERLVDNAARNAERDYIPEG